MSCARTPSMQGGRCTTASHQSRRHSVTVPRDGATPRSAVPSKISRELPPGVPSSHHATARHHPPRGRRPGLRGVTSSLGVPDTWSSTNWGPAGRVSGYVPKSPCATSLNPGLGRAKSLQTRIICPRRTSLRRSTWPRLRTRARNFERGRENGVAMRNLADLRLRPIPEQQARNPGLGRRAPRPPKDGPARR
jgi:hypothetical protein